MTDSPRILHVAVLVHALNLAELRQALSSLIDSARPVLKGGGAVRVSLLDNGSQDEPHRLAFILDECARQEPGISWYLLGGLPNRGYGAGHNIALDISVQEGWRWHLILNPDVLLATDALVLGLNWLDSHAECGLLAPRGLDWRGAREVYLVRREPSLLALLLRNLPVAWVRKGWLAKLLARHYYLDRDLDLPIYDVETQSGCFMLAQVQALAGVGGFDERFFMYFEDIDLSMRLRRSGWQVHFVPGIRICHAGGGAGRKGWKHVRYFFISALRFYCRYPYLLRR